MLFAAVLLTATVLQQPAHPPTFMTFMADVASTAVLPSGQKQHGQGVSAYDATLNQSSWVGTGSG